MNKKLNITSVTYEKLVNLGNYENERLSATVDISLDEPPEEVFEYLCQWVNERLKTEKRIIRTEQRLRDLGCQESSLRTKIDDLKNQIEILQNQLNSLSFRADSSAIVKEEEKEITVDCDSNELNYCF